ncbi:hypothetical protein [Priestia flexa]|uniref:hypothetical protein n=1 Tax=Priestia flexa TaxID=86664 RepID=UPI003D068556
MSTAFTVLLWFIVGFVGLSFLLTVLFVAAFVVSSRKTIKEMKTNETKLGNKYHS